MKRLFSMIITICMAISFSSVAFADETNDVTAQANARVSLEVVVEHWVEANYQDDVDVSRIVSLYSPYDNSGKCIGHLVSFKRDNTPAGYVVLSCEENDSPVIEFALEGKCVYDWLERQVDTIDNNALTSYGDNLELASAPSCSIVNENVLYTDFVNYSLAITNSYEVLLYNQNNQIQTFSNPVMPLSGSIFDGYVDVPTGTGNGKGSFIPGASSKSILMDEMAPGDNCCVPTAMTNLVNLYQNYGLNGGGKLTNLLLNGKPKDTFKRLIELCSSYDPRKGVSVSQMFNSLKKYCSERGYSCSTNQYWYNFWSDYTRDVEEGLPIILAVTDASGLGHAQVVVGYQEYDSGDKYLRVLTGWDENAAYIKFKASCFTGFNGYAVTITS